MLSMSFSVVPGAARPSRRDLLLWPLVALALVAIVWWLTIARAHAERDEAQRFALKEAGAAAQAYEQYITRSVAQMDQVSMQLKQSWEQSGGRLQLRELTRAGMFLDSAFLSVSVIDRNGIVASSTRGSETGRSYADAGFF